MLWLSQVFKNFNIADTLRVPVTYRYAASFMYISCQSLTKRFVSSSRLQPVSKELKSTTRIDFTYVGSWLLPSMQISQQTRCSPKSHIDIAFQPVIGNYQKRDEHRHKF